MISMSNMMNNIATTKKETGKRSGGSRLGMMPHSYGAFFATEGRFGASNRDATRLSTPKRSANTMRMTIGRY
jgi:hypothetical protein